MENSFLLAGIIGTQELIIILVIVLLLFGGTQIPKLMRNLGSGVHEFKKGMNETATEEKKPEADKTKSQ